MRIDEWVELSPEDRDKRRGHWIGHYGPTDRPAPEQIEWMHLVQQAACLFADHYGNAPEILRVDHSCWFNDQHPIAIVVATRLPDGIRLQSLPSEYLTFPVEQESLGDEIEAHKRTWSHILSRLLDWPPEPVRDFLANQEWVFRNPFFLHDPPCQWMPPKLLARSIVGPQEGLDLYKIGDEVVRAVGVGWYIDQEPDYDWEAARERIQRIADRLRAS